MSESSHERSILLPTAVLTAAAMLSGCSAVSNIVDRPTEAPTSQGGSQPDRVQRPPLPMPSPVETPTPSASPSEQPLPTISAYPTPATPKPTKTSVPAATTDQPTYQPVTVMPDGTKRFWPSDSVNTWYTSPWFDGAHPVMVGFGCTAAPYYDADPTCPNREGKHHGIDVEMPCGTPLYADIKGKVLPYNAPGVPGPAYGSKVLRIRGEVPGTSGTVDIVIGHTRRDVVQPGDEVHVGELISYASDDGAPDGCHEHFEARRPGASYVGAIDPARYLKLAEISLASASPTHR